MKEILYLIVSALTLTFCATESNKLEFNNLSEVHLNFADYNALKHKSFIDLKIENGIKPIEEQLKISEDGTVHYNFINARKRELIFNYENREFSLIISPHEQINTVLFIDELTNWESKLIGFEVSSGLNIKTNNLILSNTPFLDSLIQTASSPFQKNSNETEIQYQEKRISEMESHLLQLNAHCELKNISDKTFHNWATAQIKYKAGNDLSLYPFMGVLNRKIDDESEYFNFIKIIDSVNQDDLRYLVYLEYIDALTTSFEIIGNISDKYSEEREILKKESKSNFPIFLDIIIKTAKTLNNETITASAYNKVRGNSDRYKDSIRLLITDETLLQEQPRADDTSQSIVTLLENYDIPEIEKQELINIYRDLEGKVVFQDFWFESCVPCMKELPNYNDLMKYSKIENVEFLFYGAYMEEKDWKRVIKELGLKGKHHLLTKNQIAFFEKYFNLYGFPHHQLLKDNGRIGEKVGLRVYQQNFERIDDIIQRHHGA